MNHMAITWCASDTMYWLNLSGGGTKQMKAAEEKLLDARQGDRADGARTRATYLEGLV